MKTLHFGGIMDILYTSDNYLVPQIAASMCSICENNKEAEKIHFHIFCDRYTEQNITNLKKFVDYVDNYLPRSFSPTFTISPAPIVINKSPCVQFSKRKFSISSKEGK